MPDTSDQVRTFLENVDEASKLVFFVGAGLSVPAGYPLWSTATKEALNRARAKGLDGPAAAYAHDKYEKQQFYEMFQILQDELTEPVFYGIAEEVFQGGNDPAEAHRLLAKINCRGIITTNFDSCLEIARAQEGKGLPLSDIPQAMASDKFYVLKPHGSLSTPRGMVLSRSDWRKVAANREFKELLGQCASSYQVVFMGYSMRDPDFNHAWEDLLRERLFRSAALYCCAKGALRNEQYEELRQRNVKVIEFADDGTFAFIPAALRALIERAPAEGGSSSAQGNQPVQIAQELERYVLISLQFSPTRQGRLVLVTKALILEMLALSTAELLDPESLFDHAIRALGQDSPLLREAAKLALQELIDVRFVEPEGSLIRVAKSKRQALNDQAAKLEHEQEEWVERALAQAGAMQADIETGDRAHITQLTERVLLEIGKQVAELFLFSRPPRDEAEKIDEAVDRFCKEKGLETKTDLYKKTVKRMLFEPSDADEDILFKKLQSYFIANAYVLDPTSEKLLSQYARDHWVYFDSSIILPALAVGHPSHQVYKRLLSRTQALGMRLRVIRDMVNEVWANIRAALAAFKAFEQASVPLQDVLGGYVVMHGAGNGNVFLEGLLSRMNLDPQITAAAYMSEILGASGPNFNEEQVVKALSDSLGVETDSIGKTEINEDDLTPIVDSIAYLRKQANRYKTQKLCEHEARQFYLIHLRRQQNPELTTKIWFVTTDRFLVELQRLEKDKYPLPISYTPRSWFQYLDLIDVQSRGSHNFSRLQPRMRFGVVSGDLGIAAIQTILNEEKDLLSKGVVTVKELAGAAVRDFHLRQSIADYDKKSGSANDPTLAAKAKSEISREIKKVVGQFVAVRVQEINKLKDEKESAEAKAEQTKRSAEAEIKSLERKLEKAKHVARTLKGRPKRPKRGRR
jgi:NAD-dependent SIR2 family protein deacetylase